MTHTTDKDYADLLVRLNAIPTLARLGALPRLPPGRRTYTPDQERQHLIEDLLRANGEATW